MISEWSAELTLTEESSKALFDVLHQQDLEFINGLLDGKHGFTLQSSDGRSVELVPAPKWIPCSERLPKRQGYYICTCKDGSKYKRTTVVKWSNGWQLTGARAYWIVLAWMPLLEPWKGADDE